MKATNSITLRVPVAQHVEEVQYVVKCSCPEYAIAKQENRLSNSPLSKELIELNPLGLGLALSIFQ